MADRRLPLFILLPLVLAPGVLPGQEPPETGGSFYIDRTGGEERFIQRLVWEKPDYAYRYEITIEVRDGAGGYAEIRRESRTENFIELSLAPGSYRYRIQVYNLLDHPAGVSGWTPFRVIRAIQPELHSFSWNAPPGEGNRRVELVLRGANLADGGEARLRPAGGGVDVRPLAYHPAGGSARLVFNREALPPGRCRVYVANPGGLEASLEITVNPPAAAEPPPAEPAAPAAAEPSAAAEPAGGAGAAGPRSRYVSAEYAPLIPLDGYLFPPSGQSVYPGGASLRLGLIPLSRPWGDLGLELAPAWNMLNAGSVVIHLGAVHLNGLYQRWFFDQTLSLAVRLGAGISLVYGTNSAEQSSGSIFTWIIAANGGIALRWFLPAPAGPRTAARRSFYLEAGAEYIQLFARDSFTAYGKPFLGAGWRF
jgi:hypothetical protein